MIESHNILLDVRDPRVLNTDIVMVQNDCKANVLHITMQGVTDWTGVTGQAKYMRSDGKAVVDNITFVGGAADHIVPLAALNVSGVVKCEVTLFKGDIRATSNQIAFIVREDINTDASLIASPQFPVLDGLIKDTLALNSTAKTDADRAKAEADRSMTEAEKSKIEADRALSEANRAKVEADRAAGIDAFTKADGANAILQSLSGMMLNCQNVAAGSKLNTLLVQGNTVEVGTGDKSPSNPYVLHGVGESGTVGVGLSSKNLIFNGNQESLLDGLACGFLPSNPGDAFTWNNNAGDVELKNTSEGLACTNKTTNGRGFGAKSLLPIPPNTDLTLSCQTKTNDATPLFRIDMRFYDASKKLITYSYASLVPTGTFTKLVYTAHAPVTAVYVAWWVYSYPVGEISPLNTTFVVEKIQLEFGNKASEYNKFQGINTLVTPTGAPLYSLPDGTRDVMDPFTGVITRNVGKKVLNGTEALGLYNGGFYVSAGLANSKFVISTNACIVTHYVYAETGEMARYKLTESSGAMSPIFFNTGYATTADFKAYLAAQYATGTPVTILYKLATPTTEQIIPIQRPAMYAPITNIFGSDAYPAYLTAKHVADTLSKCNEFVKMLYGTLATRPTDTQPYGRIYIATDQTTGKLTFLPANLSGATSGNWISM